MNNKSVTANTILRNLLVIYIDFYFLYMFFEILEVALWNLQKNELFIL
jgi:hypothetical protein